MKKFLKSILQKLHIKPKLVYRVTAIILLAMSLITLGMMIQLDIIPMKYLITFIVILTLIISSLVIKLFNKSGWIEKLIDVTISGVLIIVFAISIVYINNTYKFIESISSKNNNTITYSVIIKKSNNYKLDDLKNKAIGYLKDDNYSLIEASIPITYNKVEYSEFGTIPNDLLDNKVDAIILEESYLQLANDEIDNFEDTTKVIYKFTINQEKTDTETTTKEETTNISTTPFIVYISGIDTYGDITNKSRSDVNILLVINPKTYEILLVTTPRDYYVQLHGTTGLKDKLTHAGMYGVDMSINTLEDLYGINIDYYLRVNFNTLINLVDVIGGIEVYSDTAFTAWADSSVKITKGTNILNGKSALAFARERHAYVDGDRQRGKNQELVIEAIINKVSNSEVLLNKYNSILSTLSNTFETSISTDTIKSFLKFQLDKMPNWTVSKTEVTGTDSSNYTYSMGNSYKLYVMEPSIESVNTATSLINQILTNK